MDVAVCSVAAAGAGGGFGGNNTFGGFRPGGTPGVGTLLTLLFLPALYAAWFRVRRDEPLAVQALATSSARGPATGET